MLISVDDISSKFYVGHLPMKTNFNANIDCVVSLMWLQVRKNVVELH